MTSPARSPRLLLYSHDSFGLGHLRRSVTLADAIRRRIPDASIVIATGSSRSDAFVTEPGVEFVKLPSVTKDEAGNYRPRELSLDVKEVVEMRKGLLVALDREYKPDVILVDHKFRGLMGELDEVLQTSRARGARTILGLRDVLDAPEAANREFSDFVEGPALQMYDRILVYGCSTVFDPRTEYSLPSALSSALEFVGYVVRPHPPSNFPALPSASDDVLVTCGGGDDGPVLVETYLECLRLEDRPWTSTVILGPLFDARKARHIKREARSIEGVRIHSFYEDLPRLIDGASAVVGMAGYNSAFELVRSRRPAVLVPRTHPRREQEIRARRLEELGLVCCLPAPTPRELGQALVGIMGRARQFSTPLPFDGAERVAEIISDELGIQSQPLQADERMPG